jgi:DNA end-binding protein Ku
MAARSLSTATITFGLVTVPVRVYPATHHSAGLSFHLLHEKDNVRLKQQYVCPEDGEVVGRDEMVKGFEHRKGQYVVFSTKDLKALDEKATHGIEITEFLPEGAVPPVYYEKTYYLGADKGGDKAYSLLAEAMQQSGRAALAKYAARGKDYLVLLRADEGRLTMHQLYHSDEVRDVEDVPAPERRHSPAEIKLAQRLIEQIEAEAFRPEKYEDEVRKRVTRLIQAKVKGEDITAPAPERARGQVIDLMEALKASLARKGQAGSSARAARAARTSPRAVSPPRRLAAVAGSRKK